MWLQFETVNEMKLFSEIVLVLLVAGFVVSDVAAQIKPIPVNGFEPSAKKLAADCQAHWEVAYETVVACRAALKEKNFDSIDVRKIGPAFANINQMGRNAKELVLLREPCGTDFNFRAIAARAIEQAAAGMRRTNNGRVMAEKAENAFDSHASKRQKALQKISKLAGAKKIDEANDVFKQLMFEIDNYFVWLQPATRELIVRELDQTSRGLKSMVTTYRTQQAVASLAGALKKNAPSADKLLELTDAAVASIGSSGKATLAGKEVSGPQALKQLVGFWRRSHGNLVRCFSVHSLAGKSLDIGIKPSAVIGQKLATDDYNEAVSGLFKEMSDRLAKLVVSDLKRTGGDPAVYAQYVGVLGELGSSVPKGLTYKCGLALAEVESGQLKSQVANYKKVTDEILIWKSRMAASQASAVGGDSGSVEALLLMMESNTAVPKIAAGLDRASASIGEFVGKSCVANSVHAISDKALFSQYSGRSWSTIMGSFDVTSEVSELEKDLFVSPGNPPLSVSAATAIFSARQKSFDSVGGEISGVQVEAIGTRFPTLAPAMSKLINLNQTPEIDDGYDLSDTLLRCNLTPKWIQHKYFFKKL
jgi:hypothetical protein